MTPLISVLASWRKLSSCSRNLNCQKGHMAAHSSACWQAAQEEGAEADHHTQGGRSEAVRLGRASTAATAGWGCGLSGTGARALAGGAPLARPAAAGAGSAPPLGPPLLLSAAC